MVIEFYTNPFSPPSRMVSMTLAALDVDHTSHIIDFSTKEQKSPGFLAINPRGKLPALRDGDLCLAESRAISTYLCNMYEKDSEEPLYPKDCKLRAQVDQILYVSEATYETFVEFMNIRGVMYRGETSQRDDQLPEVHKALSLYEGYLSKHPFIAAEHLTIADFHMASPLLLMSITNFNEYQKYPRTVKWLEKIRALPYFDRCNKEGLKIMDDWYKGAIEKNRLEK